jgi:hypothetical protein
MPRQWSELIDRAHQGGDVLPVIQQLAHQMKADVPAGTGYERPHDLGVIVRRAL